MGHGPGDREPGTGAVNANHMYRKELEGKLQVSALWLDVIGSLATEP